MCSTNSCYFRVNTENFVCAFSYFWSKALMCYSKIMNSCLVTQWSLLTVTHFCFLEKAIISWLLSNYMLKSLARPCIIWKLLWNKIKLEEEHIEFMKSTALNLENGSSRIAHVTWIHLSWGHTLGCSLCCHGCAVMHLSLILSPDGSSLLPQCCLRIGDEVVHRKSCPASRAVSSSLLSHPELTQSTWHEGGDKAMDCALWIVW